MAEVDTSFQDSVAIIAINRPEARNAINCAVADGICGSDGRGVQLRWHNPSRQMGC
jgi:hypothetical protein